MHEELIKNIRSIKMRLAIGVITTRNETDHLLMNQLDAMEEIVTKNFALPLVSGSLRYSERVVDFAYLCGVFNTSGIDELHDEIQRLKELGKEPHNIIEACRKQ